MRGRLYTLVLSVFCLFALATTGAAQQTTGQIFGKVTDDTGGVLPGVNVTLSSPNLLQPLTAVTSATGTYQFPSLQIGTYSVKFEMEGFKTVVHEGIQITVGFSAQINGSLGVSALQETVTVSGEAPIVDTRKAGTGNTFTREMLESVPTSRDPWVIMEQTPSIALDRANVGGTQSGQQSGIIARGMGAANNQWRLDGVNITDMSATGSSSIYFDFSTFEEMSFSTSGNDVSQQTGGVGVNLVTKSGTDKFRGSTRYLITDEKFQAYNIDDDLRAQNASAGNPIQRVEDYGFDIGGPVMRGRAWFYGAYGKQDVNVGVVNFYKQQAGCPVSATDPLAKQLSDKDIRACLRSDTTTLDTYTIKGSTLLRPGNTATWFSNFNKKFRNARDASDTRPPETVTVQDGPVWSHKFSDQHVFNDRWLAEAQVAYVGGGFSLDFPDPDTQTNLQRSFDQLSEVYGRSFSGTFYDRPLWSLDLKSTYFLPNKFGGDHSFKVGYEWRDAPTSSTSHVGGFVTARFNGAAPVSADLHRDSATNYELKNQAFYLQDTYTRGRFTVIGGVRYDRQHDYLAGGTIAPNPIIPDLLPAVTFEGLDPGVVYNNFSPRFSMTYDVGGNGRTIASVLASRYYGQLGSGGISYLVNPLGGVYLRYPWTDNNSDGFVTRDELDLTRRLLINGNYNVNDPASSRTVNAIDQNLKNDTTDELIVGLQHQFAANFAVSANYIWRRYDNFQSENDGVLSDRYQEVTRTPATGCFSSFNVPGPCPSITYYEPTTSLQGLPKTLINTPDFNRSYNGFEVAATKRYSNRWMANASFAFNDAKPHYNSARSYWDPTNIDKFNNADWAAQSGGSGVDNVWTNARWLFRVSGMYSLPFDVNVSAFLNTRQGYIFPVAYNVTGRANGAANVSVVLDKFGESRHPNFSQLDVMIERPIKLNKIRIRPSVGLFNLSNANTVMARRRVVNASTYQSVSQVLAPRVVQFGVKLDF